MSTPPKKYSSHKSYIIHPRELPLSCPREDIALWSAHPKVYLPIEKTGSETCPYCGTHFILKDE